ncbi:MAG: DUF4166 domain-containing protein [Bradyrhizobiaceae bacterium]|nr:DUF4166 domain-containing protein [Bradyrhizobiaceae bacterium]
MRGASAEPHRRPHLLGEGEGGGDCGKQELGDLRFSALMPPPAWASLSEAIRRRFSRRLAGGRTIIFVGEVTESRMSVAGWLLVQTARLFGSPFPTSRDTGVPSVVSVTEDFTTGGQIWTRVYARRTTFPQVIHSSKRFGGPTGLEEHVAGGLGMTLTLHVENGALVFRSARYFIDLLAMRLYLPAALTPGSLSVTHAECGDGRFTFTLVVVHPRLGELICQRALFREIAP